MTDWLIKIALLWHVFGIAVEIVVTVLLVALCAYCLYCETREPKVKL